MGDKLQLLGGGILVTLVWLALSIFLISIPFIALSALRDAKNETDDKLKTDKKNKALRWNIGIIVLSIIVLFRSYLNFRKSFKTADFYLLIYSGFQFIVSMIMLITSVIAYRKINEDDNYDSAEPLIITCGVLYILLNVAYLITNYLSGKEKIKDEIEKMEREEEINREVNEKLRQLQLLNLEKKVVEADSRFDKQEKQLIVDELKNSENLIIDELIKKKPKPVVAEYIFKPEPESVNVEFVPRVAQPRLINVVNVPPPPQPKPVYVPPALPVEYTREFGKAKFDETRSVSKQVEIKPVPLKPVYVQPKPKKDKYCYKVSADGKKLYRELDSQGNQKVIAKNNVPNLETVKQC